VGEKRNPHPNLVLRGSDSGSGHEYKNTPEPAPVRYKTHKLDSGSGHEYKNTLKPALVTYKTHKLPKTRTETGSLCSLVFRSVTPQQAHGRPPVSDSHIEFARPSQVSIPSSSRRTCRWVVVAVSCSLERAGVQFLSAGLRDWAITCRRFFSSAPLSPSIFFCQHGCDSVL
jgi:hypothetical protein